LVLCLDGIRNKWSSYDTKKARANSLPAFSHVLIKEKF